MLTNQNIIKKLRDSGLRPTKQRVKISKVLFDTDKTFHFTINQLKEILKKNNIDKISQATVYNTVQAFKKKGYLKEIPINSEQSYFDTNTSHHHHFYNENEKELIDIDDVDVEPIKIKRQIPGKRIKSIEFLVKLED